MSYQPSHGDNYWMINSRGEIKQSIHTGSSKSQKRIAFGNAFKTRKEARAFKQYVLKYLQKKWWQIWL